MQNSFNKRSQTLSIQHIGATANLSATTTITIISAIINIII